MRATLLLIAVTVWMVSCDKQGPQGPLELLELLELRGLMV
jgi:hypothetical protein